MSRYEDFQRDGAVVVRGADPGHWDELKRREDHCLVRDGGLTEVAPGSETVLALMPGVSRSGITITTGRFARLERDAAARFAFLLLIPIVFGAVVYKGIKHVVLHSLPPGSVGPFVVGTLAAAAVGLVAIDLLLGYVRRHDYSPFVIYRLLAAAAILAVIASGWRSAHFG